MKTRLDVDRCIVDCYRRIGDASARMLQAAERNDWEGVSSAERDCVERIADLSGIEDLMPADPSLRRQKVELVKRLLADDARIRYLGQPWLKKFDAILRVDARRSAYR